jgi:L-Ala-D/L-Glu epimerase
MVKLTIADERWPIAGSFTISRGAKTEAHVVTVTLEHDGRTGRGECVPYPRYGETVPQVMAALEEVRARIETSVTRAEVPTLLSPFAARNALDCALWDLEAKLHGKPVWQLAGLPEPSPAVTAYTLSLDTPEAMGKAAAQACNRPLLKLKLGREGDAERLSAVRRSAPDCRLIVDANEGWTAENLQDMLSACADHGVEMVEQPLPADADSALLQATRHIPVCADESAHGLDTLEHLVGKYDAINIKLDKTGGLTPAIALARAAEGHGLKIMVGCMLATSLAMAPAMLLSPLADVIDLDGPLLLTKDRSPGLRFDGSVINPPPVSLWG